MMHRALKALAAGVAAVGVAIVGVALAAAPANAQTLNTPGSLSVGTVQYSWFGSPAFCTTTALCTNVRVVANGSGSGIEFQPVSGGAVVSGTSDLSVIIQMDSLTGSPINTFTLMAQGTSPATTGATLIGSDGFTSLGVSLTSPAGSTTTRTVPGSQNRIFASMDLRGQTTGSLSLVGVSATTVPEPASMALVAGGLVALAGLRRRRKS